MPPYCSEPSFPDIDAVGETDVEYQAGTVSDHGSVYEDDGDDDDDADDEEEYRPPNIVRSTHSQRAKPVSSSRDRASSTVSNKLHRGTTSSRKTRPSPYPSSRPAGITPSPPSGDASLCPPYQYTSGRLERFESGVPSSIPESDLKKMQCHICLYRPKANAPKDSRGKGKPTLETRRSDLRRHYQSHVDGKADDKVPKNVCCGVRVDRAPEYGVSNTGEHVYEHNGEMRAGACWKVFGRRDALLRHLRASKHCVCDILPSAEYKRKQRGV